jgi:mannan endo-1,4-beta-mannosidase
MKASTVAAATLALLWLRAAAAGAAAGFVSANASGLWLEGRPFFLIGASCYYLYQRAADGANSAERALVDATLADAAALGMNVVRTPAHGEGPATWHALRPAPGQFDEAAYAQGLDYLVEQASARNIRLLFWLTNQWDANGGMRALAGWAGAATLRDFYTQPAAKEQYKAGVRALLTRRNTRTGRLYSEEPAIFGWDLANEPVNRGDDGGDVLTAWLSEMAAFVRGLDPNHLILTGSTGLFGASTPDHLPLNPPNDNVFGTPASLHTGAFFPYDAACEGVDLRRNHQSPDVDVVTVHLW